MGSPFEKVYTVTDYYDGPRVGLADFYGSPHFYECLFDDAVGYLDIFQLSPIEQETFELALEDWAIWRRWEYAFYSGLTEHETHPALPADRARHDQLVTILRERLKIDPNRVIRAKGDFQTSPASKPGVPGIMAELLVKWTVVAKDCV